MIAIDTETESLEDRTLVGFSVAKCGEEAYYPIGHRHPDIKNVNEKAARIMLQSVINNNPVVFHNSSFDVPVLTNWGINCSKINMDDTLIMANLLDENIRHGLKALVKRYFHYQMTELKEIVGTGKHRISVADADPRILEYATDDAKQTLRLFYYLLPRLQQDAKLFKLYNEIEKPLLRVIADMHLNGITIDAGRIKTIEQLCTDKTDKAKEKLEYVMEDINCNSTKQLREFFIEKERMPILKTTDKGAPSMDKEVLEIYAETNSTAKLLLEYRKYAKILSTFIPALSPKDIDLKTCKGKIFASFNQAGTTSGRFSSSKPNMQNIPKGKKDEFGIRDCIVADPGHILIGADYSQVELRILAHFSQDFQLMKAYREGKDIHRITADACGVDRDTTAKTINFGLVYGMRAKTLGKRIDTGYDEAQSYIDKFFKTYNGIKPFWELTERNIRSQGYVETFFGRKRHRTSEFQAKDKFEQSKEVGSMINAIIQGTGADMMKKSMVSMYPQLQAIGARIISTVHDEVIVSCPIKNAKIGHMIVHRNMMDAGKDLTVPIEVDCKFGRTWGEAHGDGYDLMKLMAERKECSKKQARRH